MNDDLNTYLVGAYIVGLSGKKVTLTEMVKAKTKEDAGLLVAEMIKFEGWKFGGIDYIDWAD